MGKKSNIDIRSKILESNEKIAKAGLLVKEQKINFFNNTKVRRFKIKNLDIKKDWLNGSKVSFKVGRNTHDLRLNLMMDSYDKRDFQIESTFYITESLPMVVNHTDMMSPIKDQGRLGSCVGFAVAAMKEYQEKFEHEKEVAEGKKYKRPKKDYDLSEAWVYWNSKKIDPWPNEEGTSIRCAMQVLHKIGVPCEKAYPYSDQYEGSPENWAKLISKWGLIDSYYRCTDLNDLKVGLNNSPVVIGVGVFREWFDNTFTPIPGAIKYPTNTNDVLGGHAICCVGYDDNTKLIKFKNSWGKGWGDDGYGYLSYEYINDFMWDAWCCNDLQVTRKILQERAIDNL